MPAPQVNSTVTIAPPPPNFTGDLTAIFALLATNIRVRNPSGYNTFVVSNAAPTSDSGPWLKDGTQWYVWDTGTATYVPQFLADAFARDIPEGAALPAGSTASGLFFLVYASVGRLLFRWASGAWNPVNNLSGTTAQRPAAPPAYTKFFDTTIGAELYFKPGFGWVTTSGVKGDFKHVEALSEAAALTQNPGWVVEAAAKGRTLVGAYGGVNGFTNHNPWDTFGEENHTLSAGETPDHTHDIQGMWAGGNGSNTPGSGIDGGPAYQPIAGSITFGPTPIAGTRNSTEPTTGGGGAHNNMQPSLFLVTLRKAQ